jgi:hypothetical protein
MTLKTLSNEQLISATQGLVANERTILTDILHHLIEIESRKLFLQEGYGSMFQYAVEVLHYSEAQAFRRIAAMRLLNEIPEIEKPLQDGTLNLTQLTQAREYFKSEVKKAQPLSKSEKLKVLSSLENKTTRETERLFATLDPKKVPIDKERSLDGKQTEIRFVASEALIQKLKMFRQLDSHVQNNPNYSDLFERLVDLALKQKAITKPSAPKMRSDRESKVSTSVVSSAASRASANVSPNGKSSGTPSGAPSGPPKVTSVDQKTVHQSSMMKIPSRFVPIATKRHVLNRDGVHCSFKNPITGKTCGAKARLQFDHVKPFAKGGDASTENIRVLCQNHNLFLAEAHFGERKMKAYRHPFH